MAMWDWERWSIREDEEGEVQMAVMEGRKRSQGNEEERWKRRQKKEEEKNTGSHQISRKPGAEQWL